MVRKIDVPTIEKFLHATAIGTSDAALRDEDKKKARELAGLLPEIARALGRKRSPVLVDAACGSGWVGLAALALIEHGGLEVIGIERDVRKATRARALAKEERFRVVAGDVDDPNVWPDRPDLVVALHACGAASDQVITRAADAGAETLLVVPCCVASTLPLSKLAAKKADALGLPRPGPIRRRFVESFVLGARFYEMERRGYLTEVVAFVGETVTPYNVALRGTRRGLDRTRIEAAERKLSILTDS